MAEGKKSFVLYATQYAMIQKMSDAQAGQLFKQIYMYVNDLNPADPEDLVVSVVWESIKLQLKEDLKIYEEKKKKLKDNIQKYWNEKKSVQMKTNDIQLNTNEIQMKTNDIQMDSVNVNDNVNVNVNVINKSDKSLYDNNIKKENIGIKTTNIKEKPLTPFLKSLNDFISMRTKIKKPLTENAKKRLLTKLDKLADSDEMKIAILNQSVDHCWQDIYPLHQDETQAAEVDESSKKFLEDLEF